MFRSAVVAMIHVALVATLLLGGCATAAPQDVATDPRLGATDNFRDLAGPGEGYQTDHGRVRRGQVYRSNALTLSPAEVTYVDRLGVGEVFDLRTPAENHARPDVLPDGATYTEIDVMGDVTGSIADFLTGATLPASAEAAVSLAEDVYRQLAGGEHQRQSYGTLLKAVAEADGPVLIHCTAGKDRTGWASALLLTIAGVDRRTVFDNYLLSNEYSKNSIAAAVDELRRSDAADANALEPLLGVRPSYLQAAFDVVDHQFGGVDAYLADGLHLTPADLDALRAKLLD